MPYQDLKPEMIVETALRLESRIVERFPDRGIRRLAGFVLELARDAVAERRDSPPLRFLRIAVYVSIAVLFAAAGVLLSILIASIQAQQGQPSWVDILQGLDAGVNELLLFAAGTYFLLTLDQRMLRRKALKAIYRLRSVAHIIDMHQLTKDPQRLRRTESTLSSPANDLTPAQLERYLDYCSEMLSVTGKIAVLYGERTMDPIVLAAVDSVEGLTTGISGKIWQKLEILARIA